MTNAAESPGPPRSRHVPTERQRRVLRSIEEYAAVHCCAPSDRDIARGAGLNAASSAHYRLQILKEAGYLNYTEGYREASGWPVRKRNGGQARGLGKGGLGAGRRTGRGG